MSIVTRRRPWPHALAAGIATAAALLLSGCSLLGGSPAPSVTDDPAPSTSSAPTATTTPLIDVEAGECYDAAASSDAVKPVDCAARHGYEVFASQVLPDGAYPEDQLEALAGGPCRAAFASFIGIDYDASVLTLRYIAPSESTWEAGDREVLCVVFDPAGPTTGTLAGSAH